MVHVNADDPESCLGVMRMAIEYRDTFGKDFLIDLVGIAAGDTTRAMAIVHPALMYKIIDKRPRARSLRPAAVDGES